MLLSKFLKINPSLDKSRMTYFYLLIIITNAIIKVIASIVNPIIRENNRKKNKQVFLLACFYYGATYLTRTDDLLITNQLLYQLS